MMRTWGTYVHYLLRALGRLPNVACDVFRGCAVESSQVQAPRCLSSGARGSPPRGRMGAPV